MRVLFFIVVLALVAESSPSFAQVADRYNDLAPRKQVQDKHYGQWDTEKDQPVTYAADRTGKIIAVPPTAPKQWQETKPQSAPVGTWEKRTR